MRILVTGGTGYIGSHTVVELMKVGHSVYIVDSLNNSSVEALESIKQITGHRPEFTQGDIQDQASIEHILSGHKIEGVIHFAAHKAVGESVAQPLKYYQNNVGGMVSLLKAVLACDIQNFVFSSSAAVYGNPPKPQATEETVYNPENPYGWSKCMDEIVLRDTCTANPDLKGIALRYFNVVGAHESGYMGEFGKLPPQNLLPIMLKAITTKTPLTVYGTDYPTPDGTCQRDYIHVVDLAKAHVAALNHITSGKQTGYDVFNVGTGKPTSVLEFINAFEKVNNVRVPHVLGERRPGDPVSYYASNEKAAKVLRWHATKTIEDSVRDAWRWQQYQDDKEESE
ncbi:MAG TPA: UDP-glucose 4-epimerase GalE [Candidatus Saccharimonadales bacterium]|nr:UDP-glucose 4-epimerase GalE [Candidatus Saccharimonadales bacterium]